MGRVALSEITLPDMSGGLNTRVPEYQIADNQSPDMLNLWYRDRALVKRPGQEVVAALSGAVHAISEEFNGFRVVHAGDKLWRWDEAGARRNKGHFDPNDGYPAGAQEGDYYIASAAGTSDGTTYAQGDRALYYPVFPQTETAQVGGTVTDAGYARVIVTAAGFEESELTFRVYVAVDKTAEEVAGYLRTAMSASEELTKLYEVGGESAYITLTQKVIDSYDTALNISVGNDSAENEGCTGLVEAPESEGNTMWHNAVEQIAEGMEDGSSVFVTFGDMLYLLDGSGIWQTDGGFEVSAVVPYEPVVMINASPDLSESTDSEAYNLIGAGFTVKYNGDAGGNVNYYVAEVLASDTFTVSRTFGGDVVVFAAQTNCMVRKAGAEEWKSAATTSSSSTLSLTSHGFEAGDRVQFDDDGGELPQELEAWDSDGATVYKLPLTGLDSPTVKVVIDGIDKTTGFIVNEDAVDNATVTFEAAPPTGTNNVWITACKTIEGNKKKITGCRAALAFGGESAGVTGGTRVFVTANPAYPLSYWRSDLGLHVSAGMKYFPDINEERLDQTGGAITAAAKMGSELVIFKHDSIFVLGYSFDGQDVYYPVRECSNTVGCDIPGSVQLIDNRLVFANTRGGVYMLISTNNALEDIVKPISANINRELLDEDDLRSACSCDYGRYYWLHAGDHVYLWDYANTPYYNYSDYEKAQNRLAWYRFGGIDANLFAQGSTLYCGNGSGITAFTSKREDFGSAYSAYFRSKAFDLGSPETLKTFMYVYPSFSTDGNVKATVTVESEDADEAVSRVFEINPYNWGLMTWETFSWNVIKFAKTYSMRLSMKKVSYIQIKVLCNEADRGVGLSGLKITYFTNGKVKG